ncbi:MAG: IS5 family transposase [Candidatus Micrarchaeota archaeon]
MKRRGRPKDTWKWATPKMKQSLLFPNQKKLAEYPKDRLTYSQDWEAYNKAKTREKYLFIRLVSELIQEIYPEEIKQKRVGSPNLSFNEMLFAVLIREYCGYASRKTVSELRMARDMKLITTVPHFNSISNFLKNKELYKDLQKMIIISALPLSKVETHIATDSSGFNVSPYEQWMRHKWGSKKGKSRGWIKAHIAIGAKTQIICAVEVTNNHVGDSPMFTPLFQTYSKYFECKELSADKAYSSKANIQMSVDEGITPFIPFRDTANPYGFRTPSSWISMYQYFKRRESEFMRHYHQRSKVETAFSMIKKRLGSRIRSKYLVSQKNELLCRFIVHNITVLIQEMFELGIEIDFFRAKQILAQKC